MPDNIYKIIEIRVNAMFSNYPAENSIKKKEGIIIKTDDIEIQDIYDYMDE